MASDTTDRLSGMYGNVAIKPPVRAATTANITLSGEQTIDGVAIVSADRVLVKDQTTGTENGIYIASTGTWTRAKDFNGSRDAVTGTLIKVTSGTTNGGYIAELTTTGTITVGSTSLAFSMRIGTLGAVSAFMGTVLDDATAAAARTTLGALSSSDVSAAYQPLDADLTAIAALSRTRGDLIVGGASAWEREAVGTSGQVLGNDGTDVAWADRKTIGTPQATTSGTAFDFTGIPAWAKKITVTFTGVSLSGTDALLIQIGDAGGIETSGYLGSAGQGTTFANFTTAFGVINAGGAGSIHHGSVTLTLANASSFTWVASGNVALSNAATLYVSGGSKSLSAELTQVRVTRSGTDTFDAGEVNVVYE